MSDLVPTIVFAILIAAQFLAVIYCVHHYREQSTRNAGRQKHERKQKHSLGNAPLT